MDKLNKNQETQKVTLVTGGASGIGEEIAKFLSFNNHRVIISDINEENGKLVEERSKNSIKFVKCDVTDEEDVLKLINFIKEKENRLDCLVNCAGIGTYELTASKKNVYRAEIFNKIMNVNTFGTFNVSRFAAKFMIDNHDKTRDCNGVIVNISSILATDGPMGNLAYSSSKAAVDAMALPMARDLGKYKIRVNSISPSFIETPLTVELGKDASKITANLTPLKRIGKKSEIAHAVLFAINNNFLNGAVIRVDGGVRVAHF